jgi:hypothetical protein
MMEEWKDGRMAKKRKNGMMEEWKDGVLPFFPPVAGNPGGLIKGRVAP